MQAHLAALDLVYTGVIEDTRKCIDTLEDLDLVSQDMIIGHAGELEKFQWFVRAHLENSGGQLANQGAKTEKAAAIKGEEEGAGQVVGVSSSASSRTGWSASSSDPAEQVRVGDTGDRGADQWRQPEHPQLQPVRRRR